MDASVMTAITTTITSVGATVGAIFVAGLAVWGAFQGIRYAKRAFSTSSK